MANQTTFTALVRLWLDNDPGLTERAHSAIKTALAVAAGNDRPPTAAVAEALLNLLLEDVPAGSSVYNDLIRAALYGVDWRELAADWTDSQGD